MLLVGNNSLRRIPSTIGALKRLRVLDLEENKLDQLPMEIGNLGELTRLVVQSNNLTCLPVTIGKTCHESINCFIAIRNLALNASQLAIGLIYDGFEK